MRAMLAAFMVQSAAAAVVDSSSPFTEGSLALSSATDDIPVLAAESPQLAIPRLGQIVRETMQDAAAAPRFREAQAALLATPGHAIYFGRQIQGLVPPSSGETTAQMLALAFDTLACLPSCETVSVLGELLYGEVLSPERSVEPPTPLLAARTLGRLIEAPPVPKSWQLYNIGDVGSWRSWFDAVKAGAVFRFQGIPQDFQLPAMGSMPAGHTMAVTLSDPVFRGKVVIMVVGSVAMVWIFTLCQILRYHRHSGG